MRQGGSRTRARPRVVDLLGRQMPCPGQRQCGPLPAARDHEGICGRRPRGGRSAAATIRDHHLGYFSVVAEAMGPKWLTSALAIGLVEFEADLDNFRAALDWSVESGQFDAGADLLWALAPYFFVLGLWPEGLARCRALLTAELPPVRRANLLENAGHFARNSDPAASLRMASEMTELRRSLGDDGAVARGLALISNVQAWAEPEAALRKADEAAHIARAARQPS